jgi:hypothetical protein
MIETNTTADTDAAAASGGPVCDLRKSCGFVPLTP